MAETLEKRERLPEVSALVERVRAGEVRALARAISLVEDDGPLAQEVLSQCFPYSGNALRVGLTGSPGAGKSTLVDQLSRGYRARGKTVGVVAVDPTSPYSGGAILGDRIRMKEDLGDTGLYVRSMATRGALGGLARTTADVASVIEASGKDLILIETVGVGQDEVDIVRLADVTVVVLVPGMGDDVQSIKAGIMEIADVFVINKSDREGADRVEKEVRAMQSLSMSASKPEAGWTPPVIRTVANTGTGIEELTSAIGRMTTWLEDKGRLEARRKVYWRERIVEMMRHSLMREVQRKGLDDAALDRYAAQAAAKEMDPYCRVPELVEEILARNG